MADPTSEKPLEPFRRDPAMRFLLSRPAWATPLVFGALYLLLGLCSFIDGTFFEIPTQTHNYPADALLVPFIEEPFSPVFVFLFYSCLVLYARFLSRKIVYTFEALFERGILDEDKHPRAPYMAWCQRLFDSRWAYAMSALLSLWFLAIWTAARLGLLDESLRVIIYITARDSQLAFAWILMFSVLGPHLFMSVVWRIVVCSYVLNRTFLTREIRLQPLHPDRCCGLRFIGDFTLLMSGFVIFYPVFLALLSTFYPQFVSNAVTEAILIYSGAVFYVAIASFVFLFPTYSAHDLMSKERESAMHVLNRRFFRSYEDVFLTLEKESVDEDRLENQIKLLNNIREYYREVRSRAIWPFDLRVVTEFVGIIGVPLLLMFVERLFS